MLAIQKNVQDEDVYLRLFPYDCETNLVANNGVHEGRTAVNISVVHALVLDLHFEGRQVTLRSRRRRSEVSGGDKEQ